MIDTILLAAANTFKMLLTTNRNGFVDYLKKGDFFLPVKLKFYFLCASKNPFEKSKFKSDRVLGVRSIHIEIVIIF